MSENSEQPRTRSVRSLMMLWKSEPCTLPEAPHPLFPSLLACTTVPHSQDLACITIYESPPKCTNKRTAHNSQAEESSHQVTRVSFKLQKLAHDRSASEIATKNLGNRPIRNATASFRGDLLFTT